MAVKIFFCYAHEDEPLLNKLKAHLKPLQRQGLIDFWYDRGISAGTEWEQEIKDQLNSSQIILLLVSADFMNSDYCYSTEMKRALERDNQKEARVIPIILRPVDWQDVLGKLQALPTDGTPIIDRRWHTSDEALFSVAQGIRKVVVELTKQSLDIASEADIQMPKLKPTEAPANVLKQPGKSELLVTAEDFSWLCTRILKVNYHSDVISGNGVAISPDGQTLASGSSDKTIKVWNLKTGDLLRTLTGHKSSVYCVAISADGQTLASGSVDGTIKVWNLKTGDLLHTLTGHESPVWSVAISADGQTLASGSDDGTIKVWNLKTGDLLRTLAGHEDAVLSVAISADGQTLASGSLDIDVQGVERGDRRPPA